MRLPSMGCDGILWSYRSKIADSLFTVSILRIPFLFLCAASLSSYFLLGTSTVVIIYIYDVHIWTDSYGITWLVSNLLLRV